MGGRLACRPLVLLLTPIIRKRMFFEKMNDGRLEAAFNRFKCIATAFGALSMLLVLVSVFYRDFFRDFPLVAILESLLVLWFYLDRDISKSKLLYGSAWGITILFVLMLFLMESELGLSIFEVPMLMPVVSSLVALLGVAYFGRVSFLRYGVLCVVLFLIAKVSFS